jgi:hypothetical protein
MRPRIVRATALLFWSLAAVGAVGASSPGVSWSGLETALAAAQECLDSCLSGGPVEGCSDCTQEQLDDLQDLIERIFEAKAGQTKPTYPLS